MGLDALRARGQESKECISPPECRAFFIGIPSKLLKRMCPQRRVHGGNDMFNRIASVRHHPVLGSLVVDGSGSPVRGRLRGQQRPRRGHRRPRHPGGPSTSFFHHARHVRLYVPLENCIRSCSPQTNPSFPCGGAAIWRLDSQPRPSFPRRRESMGLKSRWTVVGLVTRSRDSF